MRAGGWKKTSQPRVPRGARTRDASFLGIMPSVFPETRRRFSRRRSHLEVLVPDDAAAAPRGGGLHGRLHDVRLAALAHVGRACAARCGTRAAGSRRCENESDSSFPPPLENRVPCRDESWRTRVVHRFVSSRRPVPATAPAHSRRRADLSRLTETMADALRDRVGSMTLEGGDEMERLRREVESLRRALSSAEAGVPAASPALEIPFDELDIRDQIGGGVSASFTAHFGAGRPSLSSAGSTPT